MRPSLLNADPRRLTARPGVLALLALLLAILPLAPAAHAQNAPAGGQVVEGPVPPVMVATGDGFARAMPLSALPASTRRKLQTAWLRPPEQRDAESEAQTVTTSTAAYAPVDITVNYTGFSEPAREAFQRAVDIWAAHIESSQSITVDADFTVLEDGVLGSAGPRFFYSNFSEEARANTFYPHALADAIAGRDIASTNTTSDDDAAPEIRANFNSDFDWYFGADPDGAEVGQFDFTTVVLHELGHGLGFLGSMNVEGDLGSYGISDNSTPVIYDRFAEDVSGDALLNNGLYPNPSVVLADTLTDGNGGDAVESTVRFDGPQARLGAPPRGEPGSPRPKLYTPDEWNGGSSYSHLDEEEYPGDVGDPDALMTPQFAQREAARGPGGITCGIFADMGWEMGAACLAALGVEVAALENVEATYEVVDGQDQVRVRFSTSSPAAVDRFIIRRCFGEDCDPGSSAFQTVATVEARPGQASYAVTVNVPTPGTYTFLVRQVSTSDLETEQSTTEVVGLQGEDFALSEAFPNPFQSRTQVRLVMGEGGEAQQVEAALYDSRGRRVRTLFEGAVEDQQTFRIQAGALASGVYYLRVEGEDFLETRSVVLVQ